MVSCPNISQVEISVSLPISNDGEAERLRIDHGEVQLTINLGTGEIIAPNPIVFGETTFAVTYEEGVLTITNADQEATTLDSDDLQTLLRSLSYENLSQNNTEGARAFQFRFTDPTDTVLAITTMQVNRSNDAPVPVISDDTSATIAETGADTAPTPILVVSPESAALSDALTEEDVLAGLARGETASDMGLISVADLLSQLDISDAEQADFGIGVTYADESQGTWQYLRTDLPGHQWTDFQLGDPDNIDATPVPDGEVLLFDADTILRFIPDAGFSNDAEIQFRVWDGTEGVASNPPSTVVDDSGGAGAPFNQSSLSTASFVATLVADTDGDGIINSEDVDDDNDGILDTDEGLEERGLVIARWSGNADDGPGSGHLEPSNEDPDFASNHSNLIAGPGLTIVPQNDNGQQLQGLNSATLQEAEANGDYVEVQFTTGNLPGELDSIAFGIDNTNSEFGYRVGKYDIYGSPLCL